MKMALGTKILIAVLSVVGAAALVTVGAFLIPGWLGSDDGASPTAVTQSTTMPDGFAEEHEVTLTVDGKEYTGNYEGEYTDGLFNGYGVWVYGNYRYEGYFKDGVPNGEGTLYETRTPPETRQEGHDYPIEKIISGLFVDGYADGTITDTWHLDNGDSHDWSFEIAKGYTNGSISVNCNNCNATLNFEANDLIAGMPPWAPVKVRWEEKW